MANWPAIRAHLGLGNSAKMHRLRNAIIDRYYVGGSDLLESLELVDRLQRRLNDSGHPHQASAAADALRALQRVRDIMHDATSQWIDDFDK